MNRLPGSGADSGDSGPPHRDLDTLIAALNHRTRRETIHYLAGHTEPESDLEAIADYIASARESSPDDPVIEDIIVELHHLHLPKLADTGLIEYDSSSGRVSYLPDDQLETLLEEIDNV